MNKILFYFCFLMSFLIIIFCGFKIYIFPSIGNFPYENFNKIIYDISLGIISAYIFYFVIEYIPNIENSKKAYKVLHSQFVDIKHNLKNIVGVLNGIVLIKEDNKFEYDDNKIYFKIENVFYYEKINEFIDYNIKYLYSKINKLIFIPIYRDIDKNISDIISKINSSTFLDNTLKNVCKSDSKTRSKTVYGNAFKDNKNFIILYQKLNKTKSFSKAILMENEEIAIYNERINSANSIIEQNYKGIRYLNGIGIGKI
ncbi:conserved hypothetical protein [Treponema primitia ZAS-2]|uniref:Uncharacterized protein n=1 Tax=Treponema primitia (strain ATCC BAA-887 / DSM 12427 / ZAS-2) TaxID=545694 RepID=F5YJV0_TREPZ|nr:hypothetical protein [Treponema primitia]AEF86587.1 conserved hypothetical protein [Treponema primitia ZAS-2]